MSVLRILGIDPGLANVGAACVEVNEDGKIFDYRIRYISTKKETGKKRFVGDDNARRIVSILKDIDGVIDLMGKVSILAYETQSRGYKTALLVGALVTLAYERGWKTYTLTPKEIKRHIAGKPTATKQQVQDALKERFGMIDNEYLCPKSKREHPADALATAVAVWESHPVLAGIKEWEKKK